LVSPFLPQLRDRTSPKLLVQLVREARSPITSSITPTCRCPERRNCGGHKPRRRSRAWPRLVDEFIRREPNASADCHPGRTDLCRPWKDRDRAWRHACKGFTAPCRTTRVGHAPISCVFISTRGAPRCDVELVLSRGTIMLQRILTNPRFVLAVTGGTGIYRNASGDVRGRVLRGDRVALTVNVPGVGGGSALAGRT
jgi:hypothetical protein